VDPGLAGRRVELVFDPLELAEIEVRLDGHHVGLAVPLRIKRHVHSPRKRRPNDLSRPGSTTATSPANGAGPNNNDDEHDKKEQAG
jgi:putative transposase